MRIETAAALTATDIRLISDVILLTSLSASPVTIQTQYTDTHVVGNNIYLNKMNDVNVNVKEAQLLL